MLAQALERAQHAVQLDTARSDLPAAIAAYDEAIALLKRVIARRARNPGTEAEVERVTSIVSPRLGHTFASLREKPLLTCSSLVLLLRAFSLFFFILGYSLLLYCTVA